MNDSLTFASGYCTNTMFCAVASSSRPVRVPSGGRYVCPFCGKKLMEALPQRRIGLRAGALIAGSMAMAGVAMFAAGAFLVGPPPQKPPPHLQQTADAGR